MPWSIRNRSQYRYIPCKPWRLQRTYRRFITLGRGAIQAISTKQSINTKSSAESELVAASDGVTPAINVFNIVKCQGIAVRQLIIEQDNQSTLAMIVTGRATGPTSRHINIRYFWLNDRIAQGDISMRYMPTEEMPADLLTKQKDGKSFYKHRQALLNSLQRWVPLPSMY